VAALDVVRGGSADAAGRVEAGAGTDTTAGVDAVGTGTESGIGAVAVGAPDATPCRLAVGAFVTASPECLALELPVETVASDSWCRRGEDDGRDGDPPGSEVFTLPVAPPEPEVSAKAIGTDPTAAATPRATANAPTLPTYRPHRGGLTWSPVILELDVVMDSAIDGGTF
jgi:hypothetical protein